MNQGSYNCPNCGQVLEADDNFCENCGMQLNMQNQNVNSQAFNQINPNMQPQVLNNGMPVMNNYPNKNSNLKIFIIGIIVLLIAGGVGAFFIIKSSKEENKKEESSEKVNNKEEKKDNNDDNNNKNQNNTTQIVSYKGFKLRVPASYQYEVANEKIKLFDSSSTWYVEMNLLQGDFNTLVESRDEIISELEKSGLVVNSFENKVYNGTQCIILEVVSNGIGMIISYVKGNYPNVFVVTVWTQLGYDYGLFSEMVNILGTAQQSYS